MAISYVGGTSLGQAGVTASTDITVSLTSLTGGSDSAPITGDLVIVSLGVGDADGVDGAMTETSGLYTEVADLFAGAAATNEANLGVFYKFMTATPDTQVQVRSDLGNDAGISVAVQVFRGVKTVASGGPFDVTSTTATGSGTGAIDPPSIDTSGTAGIWTVIAGTRAIGTGTGALAGPTNYTTDFVDAPHGVDTVDAKTGMGYNTSPSDPENPGTMVWAGTEASTDSWCAVTMALAEASVVVREAVIAQTLPALTQDASATNLIEGAVDQTLPALVQDVTATVLLEVVGAQVLPALTQDASGRSVRRVRNRRQVLLLGRSHGYTGRSATIIFRGQGSELPVEAANEAVLDQVLPALTQDASATVLIEAVVAQTLPALAQDVTAEVLIEVVVTQTLPALGQDVTATVLIEAVVTQVLPALNQDVTALIEAVAVLDQILPGLTQDVTTEVLIEAIITQVLPALEQALTAQTTGPAFAEIAQVLPALTQDGSAAVFVEAIIAQTLPALGQAADAEVLIEATVVQTLPALTQDVTAFAAGGAVGVEVTLTLPDLDQGVRAVKFNTGGGVEAGEPSYGNPHVLRPLRRSYFTERTRRR